MSAITSLQIGQNKIEIGKSVVESYTDPLTKQWYRVYLDGFCVQGGFTTISDSTNSHTVSLLKEYTGDYQVFTKFCANEAVTDTSSVAYEQTVNRYLGTPTSYSNSAFTMQGTSNKGGKYSWMTIGFIED